VTGIRRDQLAVVAPDRVRVFLESQEKYKQKLCKVLKSMWNLAHPQFRGEWDERYVVFTITFFFEEQ